MTEIEQDNQISEGVEAADEMIDRQLGDYLLKRELGRGSFSCVYEAENVRTQTTVALKVFTSPREGDGFVREIGVGLNLRHPNLMTALDLGYGDARNRFVAYPLARGGSLRHQMMDGPMDPTFVRHALIQIARGLTALHVKSLVHRDIKPENVLLEDSSLFPRLRLSDLGTAEIVKKEDARGGGGSPAYIAPEQIRGRCDQRADLYAMAVLVVEMLRGKRPFTGEVGDVLRSHLTMAPDLSGLEYDVAAVLFRALAKHPEQRYQTAYLLARAIDRSLSPGKESIVCELDGANHKAGTTEPVLNNRVLATDPISQWRAVRCGDNVGIEGDLAPTQIVPMKENGVVAICATGSAVLATRDDEAFSVLIGEQVYRKEAPLYGLPPLVVMRRFAGDVATIEGNTGTTLVVRQFDGALEGETVARIPLPVPLAALVSAGTESGEHLIGVDLQRQMVLVMCADKLSARPVTIRVEEKIAALGALSGKPWIRTMSGAMFSIHPECSEAEMLKRETREPESASETDR